MKLLALDLGTITGWCTEPVQGHCGTLSTKPPGVITLGSEARYLVLKRFIEGIEPDCLAFEDVTFRQASTAAGHVYGGFRAIVLTYCAEFELPYYGVSVASIKKHATGKGNARKEIMIQRCLAKWPNVDVADDNQADAMWLWDYVNERVLSR